MTYTILSTHNLRLWCLDMFHKKYKYILVKFTVYPVLFTCHKMFEKGENM